MTMLSDAVDLPVVTIVNKPYDYWLMITFFAPNGMQFIYDLFSW